MPEVSLSADFVRRAHPRLYGSLRYCQIFVGNNQIRVNISFRSETGTFLARSIRTVKRKSPWLDFGQTESAFGAREIFRKYEIADMGRISKLRIFSNRKIRSFSLRNRD